MALSLLSHPSHSELQNTFDPLRINFDCTLLDPMEFPAIAAPVNPVQHHNNSNQSTNSNNYQEYDQVISFVDSPPNSKDSWPNEYQKSERQVPAIIDVQTIYTLNTNRKRRMDWEALDAIQGVTNSSQNDPKIPNLDNKEREKKKNIGRGSWADDIDFDLNGEFGNNGYLNNETFLSLSSALTVLKQEIPSPNSDDKKRNKSQDNSGNKTSNTSVEQRDNETQTKVKSMSIEEKSNSSIGGSKQPSSLQNDINRQSEQLNCHNITNGGIRQVIQQNIADNISARSSPTQSDSPKSESISDDFKFQYVLAAATSIATKNNEETLTYLNQGQSYEIKLKKLGDLSQYRGKILKSVIKICFHERRLQYMEKEQMQQWQASRPGERIIEVDVPLSYGLCHVSQSLNPNLLNTVEVLWDPMKEVGVYIKVNCISTEFTPKKHGGEKGVPFRIQIETYLENANTESMAKPIHAAACQIKVFKLKGADRKHKQDREKIQKRPPTEQEKYQPSYECTILNDIPPDSIVSQGVCYSPEYVKPTVSPLMPNSPVHMPKYDGIIPFANNNSPIAINSVTSTNNNSFKLMEQNMVSPLQSDAEECSTTISKDSTPNQVSQWLTFHRLTAYVATFTHFSGSDILRMSKEDLIQICGLADGIRMFNTLHAKAITPRLTIYISLDGSSYHAVYLITNTTKELTQKIFKLPGFYELCSSNSGISGADSNVYSGWGMQSQYSGSGSNLYDASKIPVYINGPSGIHVMVTDEVLNNVKEDSLFTLEIQNGKILLKTNYKNENN